jgi:hypothetical protein
VLLLMPKQLYKLLIVMMLMCLQVLLGVAGSHFALWRLWYKVGQLDRRQLDVGHCTGRCC